MKTLIQAAENKQRDRRQPAGRQFDMPGLEEHKKLEKTCFDSKITFF